MIEDYFTKPLEELARFLESDISHLQKEIEKRRARLEDVRRQIIEAKGAIREGGHLSIYGGHTLEKYLSPERKRDADLIAAAIRRAANGRRGKGFAAYIVAAVKLRWLSETPPFAVLIETFGNVSNSENSLSKYLFLSFWRDAEKHGREKDAERFEAALKDLQACEKLLRPEIPRIEEAARHVREEAAADTLEDTETETL